MKKWVAVGMILFLVYKFVDKQCLIGETMMSLPPKEASLMVGMLWGEKNNFGTDFYNSLKNSGVLHLVVVSGANLMIISKLLVDSLSGWLGRKKVILMTLVVVWGYAALVGWQIPVIRALLLVSIYYMSQLWGRKYDISRALILAVGIMLLVDYTMIFELSFWLTMMAFLGVVTRRGRSGFRESIKTSIWISLWITPILSMSMGKVSLVSPITNALLILVVEWVTTMGLLSVFMGKLALWLAYPALKYAVVVIEMMGQGGWTNLEFRFNWWLVVGWYLILFYFLRKNED